MRSKRSNSKIELIKLILIKLVWAAIVIKNINSELDARAINREGLDEVKRNDTI